MASFFLTEIGLLKENHVCPALTAVSCWPAWGTPSTACVKNSGFTWARHGQAAVSAPNSKHGRYLHQPVYSQALGKELAHFLTVSVYNSLHVQLFGGVWSRPSHARTDLAPVEMRTKVSSTSTEAESSCRSPTISSFFSVVYETIHSAVVSHKEGIILRLFTLWGTLEDAAEYLAGNLCHHNRSLAWLLNQKILPWSGIVCKKELSCIYLNI